MAPIKWFISTYTNDIVAFTFNSGSWDSEITFQITDPAGNSLGSFGPNPTSGLFLSDTSNSTCAPPSCMPPSGFVASNISGSSADISWTGASNANSYHIEYGPSGFSLGSGTPTTVTTTNYTISGLNPSSSYDVFYNLIVVLVTPVLLDHSHLLPVFKCWKYHLYNWFSGAAFVDDLEVQGLWTGDFGTAMGWR